MNTIWTVENIGFGITLISALWIAFNVVRGLTQTRSTRKVFRGLETLTVRMIPPFFLLVIGVLLLVLGKLL